MALLKDINLASSSDDPNEKLNSLVKQLNEWGRAISNEGLVRLYKDNAGDNRVLIGLQGNDFSGIKVSKVGTDVTTASDDDLVFSSDFNNEASISMNEWFGSYKLSSSYTSLNGSYTVINFDDWEGYDWYFESTYFTDAGTGYVQLFNVTDNVAVTGTEFSTTSVGEANAVYTRSSALTKPTGTKAFRVQVKIVGGNGTTENVNSMKSRMVFRTGS